jgi:hypothetical protein
MQAHEPRIVPLPGGRNQDVDQFRYRLADVMAAQCGRAGDHAAIARVQQRGHLLLERGRRPGRSHVDAGQQAAPRSSVTDPIPKRMPGQASTQCLLARDQPELIFQDPENRIPVKPCRWCHADMMPIVSDKDGARAPGCAAQEVRKYRKSGTLAPKPAGTM